MTFTELWDIVKVGAVLSWGGSSGVTGVGGVGSTGSSPPQETRNESARNQANILIGDSLLIVIGLSYRNRQGNFQPQAVPLVIYRDNLALDSLAGSITHLAEEVAVKPPFEIHGVLGEDEMIVLGVVCNPLPVNQYLGARDIEEDALIVTFLKVDGFAYADC